MKLKFNNIGKISEAEIELNAITVIAGNNDTGKSTVGKLLYAVSTVLNVVTPEFLVREKLEAIDKELRMFSLLVNKESLASLDDLFEEVEMMFPLGYQVSDHRGDKPSVIEFEKKINAMTHTIAKQLCEDAQSYSGKNAKEMKSVSERLLTHAGRLVSDENLKKMVSQSMILTEFSDSLTSEFKKGEWAQVTLGEEKKFAEFDFLNNQLQRMNHSKENYFPQSFYIDTPFVLDDVLLMRKMNRSHHLYRHREKLLGWIYDNFNNVDINYFDKALIQEKTGKIFNDVIDGEFRLSHRGFQYHSNQFSEPLEMGNVSAGIKSFAILKLLMETGGLKDCEFLILDEPEMNLHPEWQLKYADLLVILQKHYNIRIVLTSHSPYFVEAIEIYSQLHGIDDSVRFYKTEADGEMSKIIDVTNSIEKLYEDMARPFRKLEELEDELTEA